ncbi:hypothetical protein VNO77_06824 [Canavalia gladiata]|uniref:Uncharacterized protein n=1 Tax=Canavalia gladiata TaxID=3824 RepID=A0AAN9MAS6_CANGL
MYKRSWITFVNVMKVASSTNDQFSLTSYYYSLLSRVSTLYPKNLSMAHKLTQITQNSSFPFPFFCHSKTMRLALASTCRFYYKMNWLASNMVKIFPTYVKELLPFWVVLALALHVATGGFWVIEYSVDFVLLDARGLYATTFAFLFLYQKVLITFNKCSALFLAL